MMKTYLDNVRKNTPLIHNITNYVTVNDVANALLACGASPIMSDEPADVEDITAICGGLTINIGTLNEQSIKAMFLAGKKANELGHTVVLDPVGAGASRLRSSTAKDLMRELKIDVIRGNISEIKALATGSESTKGVDAAAADAVTDENLEEMIKFTKSYAAETGSIIAITGAIDLIADEKTCYISRNGLPGMEKITGTGCQLSAMVTAFITSNPQEKLAATAAAVCMMGLAGEIGSSLLQDKEGNSTYRNRIIDTLDLMDGDMLEKGAKYEVR